jgi:hypothetical protein
MQWFEQKAYREMSKLASNRRVSLQQFLRAVVIPEWLSDQKAKEAPKRKRN